MCEELLILVIKNKKPRHLERQKITPLLFLIALLISGTAFANPLSGVYTIGGTSPSYTTFALAVSDLTSNGVSGPVVFNIRKETYNEQVKITSIAGSSQANNIIFQAETGNAADVILTYSSTGSPANYVLDLNGVSYVNFNKMTIQSAGTAYSTAINIENSSTYNSFTYLTIEAPIVTANSNNNILVNMVGDGSTCSYNGVYHSTLTGGSYGFVSIYGGGYNASVMAEYNSFVNQYAGAINEVRCLHGATIKYNTITTNSTDTAYKAIQISIEQDTLSNNQIYKCPGTGIYFNNCSPYIVNNFVEIEGTGVSFGILHKMDNYCGDKIFVSGNTVLVKNTNSQSAAFSLPFPGYAWNFPFNFLRDNIFVNRGGGYAISIVNTGSMSTGNGYGLTPVMDYNDYYTTGAYIGQWGTTPCATLANWQSTSSPCGCGADAHSLNINPGFVSDYDLHITVDNVRGGTPAPEESNKDIDGDTRNNATPDMGADELTGAPSLHTLFSASGTTVCDSTSVNFTDNSSGAPTGWQWTFNGGTPGISTNQNPTVTYNTAGTFDVKLVITNSAKKDSLIEVGYITVNPLANGGSIVASQTSICSGNSIQTSDTGATGTIQWQFSFDGINFTDISGATSSSYNSGPIIQSIYYQVKATNGCGSRVSPAQEIIVTPQGVAGTIGAVRDTVCQNTPGNLTLSGSSGGSIQWQSSSTNSNFSEILNAPDTNSYKTEPLGVSTWFRAVVGSGNCKSISNSTELIVPPPLIASYTELLSGETATFNSSGSIGDIKSYYWDFGDEANSTEANPIHTFPKDSTYNTCLTVYDGSNCSYTLCHNIVLAIAVVPLGKNWLVYPDPFSNELNIEGKALNSTVKSIIVRDVLGRIIINKIINTPANSAVHINVSALAIGMYYLTISTQTTQYVQKIIKQ